MAAARGNFENITLRITGHNMPPFSTIVWKPDGSPHFAGFSGYMFDVLVEAMRFRYVIKLPPDYSWGARHPNGSWAGQFCMVVRNESDMLVGPVAPSYDRIHALQPLPQYYATEAGHFGGVMNPYVTNVFGYVNAFNADVWMGLFSAMVGVSLLLALTEARFRWTHLAVEYYFAFLSLFSIFLMEAGPRVTRGSVRRWLVGTWWMAVFVLASGFTGHMKASLTMKEEGSRIDSLADIIARPEVVPVIIKGTTYEELFRSSPDRMQRLTWERANRLGSIIPPKQVFTREVYEDVLHSKKVMFLDEALFYNALMHLYKEPPKGHFYMARELVKNFTMGMWVNTGLPASLRRELHVRTRWIIESGLPERFHKNFVERAKHKSESGPLDAGQSFSFHTLRVEDVSGLFYLLLAGYGAAVVGAVIEQFAYFVTSSRCFRRHI